MYEKVEKSPDRCKTKPYKFRQHTSGTKRYSIFNFICILKLGYFCVGGVCAKISTRLKYFQTCTVQI